MTEFFAGLIAGYVLTWYGTLAFILLGIWSEHNESPRSSIFFLIVTMAILYAIFPVTWLTIGTLALGTVVYLIIGTAWSFWRYQKFVLTATSNLMANWSAEDLSREGSYANRKLKELHPSYHTSRVVSWIVAWPFSFVESVVGDIFDMIRSLVNGLFKGVYAKIYNSAVDGLPTHID